MNLQGNPCNFNSLANRKFARELLGIHCIFLANLFFPTQNENSKTSDDLNSNTINLIMFENLNS